MVAEQNRAYSHLQQILKRKRTRCLAAVMTCLDSASMSHLVVSLLKVELLNFS